MAELLNTDVSGQGFYISREELNELYPEFDAAKWFREQEEVRVWEERSDELRSRFHGMPMCTADTFVLKVASCQLCRHF